MINCRFRHKIAPSTARAIDLAVGERSEGPVFLAGDGRRLDRHGAARIVRRLPAVLGSPNRGAAAGPVGATGPAGPADPAAAAVAAGPVGAVVTEAVTRDRWRPAASRAPGGGAWAGRASCDLTITRTPATTSTSALGRLGDVLAAGATRVVVVRAITEADDPASAARAFAQRLRTAPQAR
jgi:hypothetical protein